MTLMAERFTENPQWRLLLAVGFLGAYDDVLYIRVRDWLLLKDVVVLRQPECNSERDCGIYCIEAMKSSLRAFRGDDNGKKRPAKNLPSILTSRQIPRETRL
jgi:hypothetical protein